MKEPTNFQITVEDNLTLHRFAGFIERPGSLYIGMNRLLIRDPRAFALNPFSAGRTAFQWTIHHQGTAITTGFFLHRSGDRERVNIIPMDWHGTQFDPYDGYSAMSWLEQNCFISNSYSINIFSTALRFIRQQDQFGYTGAWDRRVEFFSNRLIWYKAWYVQQKSGRLSERDKQVIALDAKRRRESEAARNWAYASHLNRTYINPKTDEPHPHTKAKLVLPKPKLGRPSYGQSRMSRQLPGSDPHDPFEPIPSFKPKRIRSVDPVTKQHWPKLSKNVMSPKEIDDAPVKTLIDPSKIGVKS